MNKEYLKSGRQEQKLRTYNEIFKAAHRLLMKGMVLSLEGVAKEAGISRATIYRYYSNIEILASELPLAIKDREPESFTDENKHLSIQDNILKIQDYYLNFTIENEPAFRKFLGAILNSDKKNHNRGGRRVLSMQKLLSERRNNLSELEKKQLISASSLFMGIEALIVAKDVCDLENQEAIETLKWGLEMLLKGALQRKS